mgnify:CR=1 FL=1
MCIRDSPISDILFVPLRRNPESGAYEKLVSFSYTYTTKNFNIPQVAKFTSKSKTLSNAKTGTTQAAGSSVLASGSWYKISIPSTGIFKIDYTFLKSTGINPDNIDPRKLKIYGNGGAMLPQANIVSRPDDLLENSIFISGENDGVFNSNDYILFYAKGPDAWTYNSTESIFKHSKNIYNIVSYYFLTVDATNGARIQTSPNLGSGAQTITIGDDYDFYENDLSNFLSSGREWYGDVFDQSLSNSYTFQTPGIVSGSTFKTTSAVLGRSTNSTSFNITVNNAFVGSQSIGANNLSTYDAVGVENRTIHSSTISVSYTHLTLPTNREV